LPATDDSDANVVDSAELPVIKKPKLSFRKKKSLELLDKLEKLEKELEAKKIDALKEKLKRETLA
jgi:hypothetical protein